jgi:type II secretory pathway component PulM
MGARNRPFDVAIAADLRKATPPFAVLATCVPQRLKKQRASLPDQRALLAKLEAEAGNLVEAIASGVLRTSPR